MVFPGCFGAVSPEEAFVLCSVLLFRGLVLQKETSLFRRVFCVFFLTYEATEDKTIRWHHCLNGHEFEHTPEGSEGQGTWCAAVYGVTKSQTQLSD